MQYSRYRSRRGPHEETSGEYPFHLEAIHQPASRNLHAAIRPEKYGEQSAELRSRKA